MRELRLVGVEDGAVTLEALDGEKLRLQIDEQVRSAVRNAAINATSSLSLTPREIQDRIRSGETIAEIVELTGVNEDFVTKFAQPVMDELAHIIASALAIRVTIAGDRFNDPTQVEFGELIEGRLVANSALDIEWSSRRLSGGAWQLECSYSISGTRAHSVWLYEPRRFHLAPDNEAAIALSNSESIDGPIAKLRSLNARTDAHPSNSKAPAAFRKSDVSVGSKMPVGAEDHDENSSGSTTNLLEEMRKRREAKVDESFDQAPDDGAIDEPAPEVFADHQGESIELEPEPETDFDEPNHEPEVEIDEAHHEAEADKDEPNHEPELADDTNAETQQPTSEPTQKKARTSMPSWDQIVFGTKPDDQ